MKLLQFRLPNTKNIPKRVKKLINKRNKMWLARMKASERKQRELAKLYQN